MPLAQPTVELTLEHGYSTLRLRGELDLAARSLLGSVAGWRPPVGDRPGLLVDLTSVTFIDADSTRRVGRLAATIAADPTLVLCAPGVVLTALGASGFDEAFRLVPVGMAPDGRLRATELRLLMQPFPDTEDAEDAAGDVPATASPVVRGGTRRDP